MPAEGIMTMAMWYVDRRGLGPERLRRVRLDLEVEREAQPRAELAAQPTTLA
jgi:hypothetical protein